MKYNEVQWGYNEGKMKADKVVPFNNKTAEATETE